MFAHSQIVDLERQVIKMEKFTHFDEKGNARMVDVSNKNITERIAIAEGTITMSPECLSLIKEGKHKKGDVLTVATVGGIMAAKKTSDLIPMSHNILLTSVNVVFEEIKNGYKAIATVKCDGKTGVEMEALVAVNNALLTIYDMCKAVDKKMVIKDIHLVEKHGGKSGDFYF